MFIVIRCGLDFYSFWELFIKLQNLFLKSKFDRINGYYKKYFQTSLKLGQKLSNMLKNFCLRGIFNLLPTSEIIWILGDFHSPTLAA